MHDQSFWQGRWGNQQIGFHEGKPNDLLVAHVERLERQRTKLRILVPLAGKAVDLSWLAARGHEVVGVEFVRKAVEEFFAEAPSECGVTMVCDDFFRVDPGTLGKFDVIYDRAALIALDPPTRAPYVERCRALLKDDGVTFLISITYDQSKAPGPPWSIDQETVRQLFAGRSIELLETRSSPPNPRLRQAGIASLDESAYLIARVGDPPGV